MRHLVVSGRKKKIFSLFNKFPSQSASVFTHKQTCGGVHSYIFSTRRGGVGRKGKLSVAGGRRYLRFLCLGGLRGRSSKKNFTHPGGEIQIKKSHRLSRGVLEGFQGEDDIPRNKPREIP